MYLQVNGKKVSILPDKPMFSLCCKVNGEDELSKEEVYMAMDWVNKYLVKSEKWDFKNIQ